MEVKKVHFQWRPEMKIVAVPPSGHEVLMDDAEGDTGPRPMELVLVALGGCTGMDVVSILRRMRVQWDDFRIEIEAKRKDTHPKVYVQIHLRYIFVGKDLPLRKLERAVELSQNKYCSVTAMLRCTATITHEIVVHDPDAPLDR